MKSSIVNSGDNILATQYDNLRADAYGASLLLAHQQTIPGLTLKVEPGICFVGTVKVVYAGGNSPSFTVPISHPRIDLLTVDNTGTIAIVQGIENVSPTIPIYPTNKIVLCEVYNRVGETSIKDTDDTVNGYIQNDVRRFLELPVLSSDPNNCTVTYNSAGNVATIVDTDAGITYTYGYDPNTNWLISLNDGTNTWTATRNGAGQITAIAET